MECYQAEHSLQEAWQETDPSLLMIVSVSGYGVYDLFDYICLIF